MGSFVIRNRWKGWPLVVLLSSVTYLRTKHWLSVRLICESMWNASEFYGMATPSTLGVDQFQLCSWASWSRWLQSTIQPCWFRMIGLPNYAKLVKNTIPITAKPCSNQLQPGHKISTSQNPNTGQICKWLVDLLHSPVELQIRITFIFDHFALWLQHK